MSGLEHVFLDLDGRPASRGMRIFRVAFLMTAMLILCGIAGHELYIGAEQSRWTRTPCRIVAAGFSVEGQEQHDRDRYAFSAAWTYTDPAGRAREASQVISDDDARRVDALFRQYARERETTCYVVVFLGLFAFLLPVYVIPQLRGTPTSALDSSPRIKRACLGLLIVGGITLSYFLLIVPLVETVQALTWPAKACRVWHGRVTDMHVHPGVVYTADVLYEYEVAGVKYRSNHLRATEWRTPWYYGKRHLVDWLRNESRCYVDPTDPTRSVLLREPSLNGLFGVVGLVPLTVGILGVRPRRRISVRALLWTASVLVLVMLSSMIADLMIDVEAGSTAWPEFVGVAVVAGTFVGLVLATYKLRPGTDGSGTH
jgi:hypothetical protein